MSIRVNGSTAQTVIDDYRTSAHVFTQNPLSYTIMLNLNQCHSDEHMTRDLILILIITVFALLALYLYYQSTFISRIQTSPC